MEMIKKVGLTAILLTGAFTLLASQTTVSAGAGTVKEMDPDTIIVEDVKTGERRKVRIIMPGSDSNTIQIERTDSDYTLADGKRVADEVKKRTSARPIFGLTFNRIDLGWVRLVDDGSFHLSAPNEDLAYRSGKTYNFGFDVVQAGYRFSDHFRIFLSGGFDWTYIRLKKNIRFHENTTPLSWDLSTTDYRKNRLTSTYLRLPLTFEFRSGHHGGVGRVRFAFGPEAGVLLKGTQRLKSDEFGRQKFRDDYNFSSFRYGAFARVGAGPLGIYAKYYFNDVFENSPNQDGLQSFVFGVMLGF